MHPLHDTKEKPVTLGTILLIVLVLMWVPSRAGRIAVVGAMDPVAGWDWCCSSSYFDGTHLTADRVRTFARASAHSLTDAMVRVRGTANRSPFRDRADI